MSAPAPSNACLQTCPNCAALVDVSEQEPLAKIHCPLCGTAMRAARQFNHFSVIEALGTGGMGAVYKALDRNLNRLVALKLLRKELSSDEKYIIKLEDEAKITASINHPYVVKVFSFGCDQGQYYIAMELVDKGSLDDLMQLQNRVAELQVLQVGIQVAGGLQAAYERGLIHRDVKPGNILFADAHTAKITDFGLALLAEREAESRGEIWGTPYYIAPEKLNNEPEDFRSDIYSLGGTLFHAVAGRPPFEAENASLVALKHLKSRAVSLQAFAPDVSSETAYVINRMLHKDPGQRYASYSELIDHLKYAVDTVTAQTGKPRAKARVVVEAESQSNLTGLLTLLLLAMLMIGGILAYVFRDRFFGTAAAGAAPHASVAPANSGSQLTDAYEEARRQMIDGQLATAQESFAALAARPDIPQPMLDWARLHQGMAAMLNHQLGNSRDIFAGLQKAGLFSTKEGDRPLANFFVEMGRHLADNKPVPASAVKLWNANTFESMALLLFGIKDWELGKFDDAAPLFDAFLNGKPVDPYRWITDYKPIARKCVHDFALYRALRAKIDAGTEDPAVLRSELLRTRDELQTTGKLIEVFYEAETNLKVNPSGRPAAGPAPAPSPSAAPPASPLTLAASPPAGPSADVTRWQVTRDSYEQMVRLYRFDEANAVIQRPYTYTDPDFAHARNVTRARSLRLLAFKRTLMSDLNTRGGYPESITTRRNVVFPRGIQSVTADEVHAATPYGVITIPWTDLSPATLLSIAAYFTDASSDLADAAQRRLLAATFAVELGLPNQARELANRAAHDRPEYEPEKKEFFSTTPTPGSTPPAAAP